MAHIQLWQLAMAKLAVSDFSLISMSMALPHKKVNFELCLSHDLGQFGLF